MAPGANPFATAWNSFWHSMTSYDRHASHDSPYRTGRHIPLPQSRHAPLTSVASAQESRPDLAYTHDEPAPSNGFIGSPKGTLSPRSPYSPGLRSALTRKSNDNERANSAEIQMQNFSEGLPPPPPVSHSWKRIDRWAEDNYAELWSNLCEGATLNDVNELEHELDSTLPQDLRESLQLHDGQERGGLPTGIIFGCMLLDCEEIVEEWQNWRRVAEEFLTKPANVQPPQVPTKAFAGTSSSSSSSAPPQQAGNPLWRQDLLARQDSQPPNAVQKAYYHPGWIPLARDWGGNYIAVDLAPGPAGKWGQIIIYGRDYDCKYVISRSWGNFMATLADDLSTDKVSIDEETGDLKLLEFKKQGVEPPYLEILRWRCDQKYGRKGPRRKPGPNGGLRINSNLGSPRGSDNANSPYASPTSAAEERGRSPHRFSSKGPAGSPRAHISSPLARVAEEAPTPLKIQTDLADHKNNAGTEKLVSIDTPRPSGDLGSLQKPMIPDSNSSDKENQATPPSNGKAAAVESSDMKTVEI